MLLMTNVFHTDEKERMCIPSIFKFKKMIIVNSGSDEVYLKIGNRKVTLKPKEKKEFGYVEYFFARARSGKQRLDIVCIG